MDNELTALTTIFTEFYYWMTVVLMFLIEMQMAGSPFQKKLNCQIASKKKI